jgi:hypothetical protein
VQSRRHGGHIVFFLKFTLKIFESEAFGGSINQAVQGIHTPTAHTYVGTPFENSVANQFFRRKVFKAYFCLPQLKI